MSIQRPAAPSLKSVDIFNDLAFAKLVRVLLFASVLAFAACGDSEVESDTPVMRKPASTAPADPTAKMARAVTVGKSNVPIELKYEVVSKPMMGQPIEIELAVTSSQTADSMAVTFAPSPGLTLSVDSLPDVEVVKSATPYRSHLIANADRADVFFVTVTATLYTAGTSSTRTFALPLILSDPNAPAATPAAPNAAVKKS